jgi:hypothetical protein
VADRRLGRGARWGIGLAVAGTLLLASIVAGAIAVGQAVGGGECLVPPFEGPFGCIDDRLTAQANAQVRRVHPPEFGDTYLDLEYTATGGDLIRADYVLWPPEGPEPVVGGTVQVSYDPADPEYAVTSSTALAAVRSRAAASPDRGARPAVLWTAGLSFAASCATLIFVMFWAGRAPRREPPAAAGWSGVPGYGYAYPPPGYGYPPPGYGQPAPGYGQPAPGYGQPAPGYAYPAPGYGQPAPGYGQPAPGYSYPPGHPVPQGHSQQPPPATPPPTQWPAPQSPWQPPAGPPAATPSPAHPDQPDQPAAPPSGPWNAPG